MSTPGPVSARSGSWILPSGLTVVRGIGHGVQEVERLQHGDQREAEELLGEAARCVQLAHLVEGQMHGRVDEARVAAVRSVDLEGVVDMPDIGLAFVLRVEPA